MALLPRRAVTAIVALLLGFAPALGLLPLAPLQDAEAFNPPVHIAMFEQALGDKFSAEARGWVAQGLTRSDNLAGQGHPEWHFDSANSPVAICSRWSAGPDALLKAAEQEVVEAFRIVPTEKKASDRLLTHRSEALRLYGQYLHAIQDFYTHTNWIELHLDPATPHPLRTLPTVAPIQKECDATALAALTPTLQSGFFGFDSANLFATVTTSAPDFCGPVAAPRPPANSGARLCHGPPHPATMNEILSWIPQMMVNLVNWQAGRDVTVSTLAPELMLSKDLPDLYHGSESFLRPDGTVTTYHAEAVRLATEATPETFQVFHDRVVSKLKTALPKRDPECLFQVLVGVRDIGKGGDLICPGLEGSYFRGDAQKLNQPMLAEAWGPAGQLVIKSMHAEISLGPAREAEGYTVRDITGGVLSFQVEIWQDGKFYETQTFATSPDPNVPGASGSLLILGDLAQGTVEFIGTWDSTYVQGPQVAESPVNAFPEVFSVVMDAQGQLVLCRTEAMTLLGGEDVDADVAYQQCLERALVVLQPVDSEALPPLA